MMCFANKGFSVIHFAPALALIQSEELISVFAFSGWISRKASLPGSVGSGGGSDLSL